MRISHKHKFIFFSNPKTGSESVRALLTPFSDVVNVTYSTRTQENPFYAHITPQETRDLFQARGLAYESYFRFTFVRNPWARLVSLYAMIHADHAKAGMLTRMGGRLKSLAAGEAPHPSILGFRQWLRTIETSGRGGGGGESERWRRYGTYTIDAYAGDGSGNLLVDRVYRLEDMATAIPDIIQRAGLPLTSEAQAPHVNSRKHARHTEYYDTASKDLVSALYASDIERFDYQFEGN